MAWCRERMEVCPLYDGTAEWKLISSSQRCKDAIAKGTVLPYCTLARLLQDPKLGGLDSEDEAAYINLELIGAAADTVSPLAPFRQTLLISFQSMMTMWGFLEAMLENPEVQKKAQKELGRFVRVCCAYASLTCIDA